jgi:hypothetical protein
MMTLRQAQDKLAATDLNAGLMWQQTPDLEDYTRAPDAAQAAQQSAAIDPIFNITDEDSYFWSSTTHLDGPNAWGAYLAFGSPLRILSQAIGGRGLLSALVAHKTLVADQPWRAASCSS